MRTDQVAARPCVQVYGDFLQLQQAAAGGILRALRAAVDERGVCLIALSGGQTPRGVYRQLAAEPFRSQADWSRVHLFWGDERMVPPDDPESNYGMAQRELISRVPLPPWNVHRIRGEIGAHDAAREYAGELRAIIPSPAGCFDLVLLGVGEDGHTASLFPGTGVLDEEDDGACAVFVPRLGQWRVTLTLPVINASREVLFLVSGKAKAPVVQRILSAPHPEKTLPATLVRPGAGTLHWMLDEDAASGLGRTG